MPFARRRVRKSTKPMNRKKRQFGVRKSKKSSPTTQVYTETYKCSTECAGVNANGELFIPAGQMGSGFNLVTQMNLLPQVASQSSLYNSQKILSAKFTIVPKWGAESYNQAELTQSGALSIAESARICYAKNDVDPQLAAPLTELEVLKNNGCRIKQFLKPIKISIKPKPWLQVRTSTTDVNVYQAGQWVAFDSVAGAGSGALVPHTGTTGFISKDNTLANGFLAVADVQCTVRFVLRDSR